MGRFLIMTETPQPYQVPNPEEIDDLLKGDFTVDEPAPDDKVLEVCIDADSKVIEVGDLDCDDAVSVLSDIVDTYFNTSISIDFAQEILEELEAMGWRFCQTSKVLEVRDRPDESSKVLEVRDHPGTTSEVLEEGENFIRPIVLKAWLPGAIYIDLYDDGWEVRQHPDPLDKDISKSDWSDEKSEELYELSRLRLEMANTLQSIQVLAMQIENAAQAMRDGGLSGWEHKGVQLLVKFLAAQILDLVRKHLRVNLEVVRDDIKF
jgi:hypothetical protein